MPLISQIPRKGRPLLSRARRARNWPEKCQVAGGRDYLAFIGRSCPEKRLDRAIEIAVRPGVPLIVDDGVTGFIVDSIDEAVAAFSWATALDRRAIRQSFEERFSAERMAHGYVELYTKLLHPIAASADPALIRARLPDAT